MKKLPLVLAAVAVIGVVAVGALAYSPYAASNRIEAAFSKNDPQKLGEVMDLTAIQTNYQKSLKAELDQAIAQSDWSSPLLVLGPAMGEMMVERRARELSERPTLLKTIATGTPTLATPGLPLGIDKNPLEGASRSYAGLNRFAITTQGPHPVELILHRQGLTSWKVAEIHTQPVVRTPPTPVVQR